MLRSFTASTASTALQRWPPAVLSCGLEIADNAGHISTAAAAVAAAVLDWLTSGLFTIAPHSLGCCSHVALFVVGFCYTVLLVCLHAYMEHWLVYFSHQTQNMQPIML